MPKKSRRERKRIQPRPQANEPAPPTTTDAIPAIEFTDFSQGAATTSATGEALKTAAERVQAGAPADTEDEEIESILDTEDAAKRFQQTAPAGGLFGAGTNTTGPLLGTATGISEPEVARALRRVKRKGEAAPAAAITPADVYTLSPDSAAIPMSQVPYVPSDLRRVAFSAAVIVIFIVVSGLLITHLFN